MSYITDLEKVQDCFCVYRKPSSNEFGNFFLCSRTNLPCEYSSRDIFFNENGSFVCGQCSNFHYFSNLEDQLRQLAERNLIIKEYKLEHL